MDEQTETERQLQLDFDMRSYELGDISEKDVLKKYSPKPDDQSANTNFEVRVKETDERHRKTTRQLLDAGAFGDVNKRALHQRSAREYARLVRDLDVEMSAVLATNPERYIQLSKLREHSAHAETVISRSIPRQLDERFRTF